MQGSAFSETQKQRTPKIYTFCLKLVELAVFWAGPLKLANFVADPRLGLALWSRPAERQGHARARAYHRNALFARAVFAPAMGPPSVGCDRCASRSRARHVGGTRLDRGHRSRRCAPHVLPRTVPARTAPRISGADDGLDMHLERASAGHSAVGCAAH